MKRRIGCLLWTVGLLSAVGCAHTGARFGPTSGITIVKVEGTHGTPVSASYVQDGYRVPVTGTLPLLVIHDGLSEFEVFKSHPDERLALAAQYEDHVWHSEVVSTADEGVDGLRVRVHNGISVEKIKR